MDIVAKLALIISASLLQATVVLAVCEIPPPDDPYIKLAVKCQKQAGSDMMCIADCFASETGVVDKDGTVHEEVMDQVIEKLDDGELKEAVRYTKEKCFKNGMKINRNVPKCGGYLKVAKCARKFMKEKCPALTEMYGI